MDDNETGWVKDNGNYYYYYSDGTMATGWQKLDGDWYYFYGDGSMTWSNEVDGYYLGADGRMVTDEKWVNTEEDNSGTWYYVGSDEKVVTGWNKIGDDFYYFNHPGGSMTWDNTIDGFYLDNDGKMVSGTGWLKDEYSGEWYYFSDGSMAHDDTIGGYHVDNSGKMITGTGWVPSDGSWYYLKDDGEVATNWQYINDNWYYFYKEEGSMAKDTTIEGYSLNDDGEWVPNDGNNDSNEDDESDSTDEETATNEDDIWLPSTLYSHASDSEKYSISSQNILVDLSIQWFNAKTVEEQHKIERQLLYFRANIPNDDTITKNYEEGLDKLFEPIGLTGELILNMGGNSKEVLENNIDKLNELKGEYIYNSLTDDTVIGAGITRRLECVGRTPSKSSRTGREVIARMMEEGKIDVVKGKVMFQASDDEWYELKYGDMAHKEDAVKWWNETGRRFGEKAPEVREWMLDPDNYYIEHYSINRSQGAKIGETYKPSLEPEVTPIE